MGKIINILFFLMCLATSSNSQRVDGIQNTLKENLEMERELKLINELPVKSIHTKFGYIVDCIDINKQPAFNHPLLKNHKLQRKPSFQQTKAKTRVYDSPSIGFEEVTCPRGTVPIRRTAKDDLIQAKSILNTQDNPTSHVAEVALQLNYPLYAVKGIASVYNPKVEEDQTSAAHLWVENGEADSNNKIMVGWHVSPQLHGGDHATYIYSRWTTDNFKNTGCYNVQCPGFVQTDQQIFLGAPVKDTSIYGGLQTELPISIEQDPSTKNWWLSIIDKHIGYFPAVLFSNMSTAKRVGWGGSTTTLMGNPSPPMGSGFLPDDNFIHSCYFRQIEYQDGRRYDDGPFKEEVTQFTDKPNCYGVKYYEDLGGEPGYALQFGGPGGSCD